MVLLLTSCQGAEERTPPADPEPPPSEPEADPPAEAQPEPPPAPPAPSAPVTATVEGLAVTRHPDGRIAVRGVDRWGARLDATYQDAGFFRSALPVLGRSITDAQAAALARWAEENLPPPTDDDGAGAGEGG